MTDTTIRQETTTVTKDDKTKKKSDPPETTWAALKKPGRPHPVLWHTWLTTGWVGAAGLMTDSMDWGNWTHAGITAGAGALGSMVGAAVPNTDEEHQVPLAMESGALGGVTGLAAGTWAWCASTANLLSDMGQPAMWGSLALGGLAWGAWYASLRMRLAKSRIPGSTTTIKLSTKTLKGEYQQIFSDAGFGRVEVVEVKTGHGGVTERAVIELDPMRTDTSEKVIAAKGKLTGHAVKIFKERRGLRLPSGALNVAAINGDASRVCIDIVLQDVGNLVIKPDVGHDITQPVTEVGTPLFIGLFDSGDPIEQPESGPHGFTVGASGSGKSTYFRAQIANYLPRAHVCLLAAGTSKFYGFLRPFLQPMVDGKTSRSPFAAMGGGDGGTDAETISAVKIVMMAYMEYRNRMSNPRLPRDDGNNLIYSKQHPLVIVYLDEVNDLIKRCKEDNVKHRYFDLPNGERLHLPAMLEAIGSKGRSEGVELEIGTQRTTDSFLGFNARDLTTNCQRRAIFRTDSQHDASWVNKKIDGTKIRQHSFYVSHGAEQEQQQGKVIYYTADDIERAMVAADANDTWGDITGDEADALGELWSGRWSPERWGPLAAYFGLPGGEAAAARAAEVTTTSTNPAASTGTRRDPVLRDPRSLRSPALDAAIARARREAAERDGDQQQGDSTPTGLTPDQEAMWQATMADLNGLSTTSDTTTQPAAPTVPRDATPDEVLRQVRIMLAGKEGLLPRDILLAFGWVCTDDEEAIYNTRAGELRDRIRAATGQPKLVTQQRTIDGVKGRYWLAADLLPSDSDQ